MRQTANCHVEESGELASLDGHRLTPRRRKGYGVSFTAVVPETAAGDMHRTTLDIEQRGIPVTGGIAHQPEFKPFQYDPAGLYLPEAYDFRSQFGAPEAQHGACLQPCADCQRLALDG